MARTAGAARRRPRITASHLHLEQTADCLAGVVTQAAERGGHLEPGDLAEAEKELEAGGDIDCCRGYQGGTPVCLPQRPQGARR
jgi:predicted metalloprotease